MISLCTIDTDLVHLIDIPLEQAQVSYRLVTGGSPAARKMSIIYVAEADIDRARVALERFGTFRGPEI
ncbi:MAG: hypothetical protein PHS18_04155 [Sphaerochaetaceae bacterium]|jgi:hypothetical protein|nr:hypothetical protein [Sphaerochaetaceae bacterium]MDD5076261.1 hypothetical protein [Sphaerochaetaceae bacterium]